MTAHRSWGVVVPSVVTTMVMAVVMTMVWNGGPISLECRTIVQ